MWTRGARLRRMNLCPLSVAMMRPPRLRESDTFRKGGCRQPLDIQEEICLPVNEREQAMPIRRSVWQANPLTPPESPDWRNPAPDQGSRRSGSTVPSCDNRRQLVPEGRRPRAGWSLGADRLALPPRLDLTRGSPQLRTTDLSQVAP